MDNQEYWQILPLRIWSSDDSLALQKIVGVMSKQLSLQENLRCVVDDII